MYNYASKSTVNRCKGLHPNLIMVIAYALAISEQDFFVSEGVRTAERQNELYQKGRTIPGPKVTNLDGYTKKSNHQPKSDGYGYAVDVYYVGWKNSDSVNDARWVKVWDAFKIASSRLRVPLTFGKDWVSLKDNPHIELNV